ncbi:MAG: exodeoxyribonuclease VII small subunit [Victivallales bacterium]|nr:exodeoxyribonuclease VII small subunit [Victivallales bacterium]MCF7888634.1 exodeoxyribonuclease VII small subunit [Victivallales bacterium]
MGKTEENKDKNFEKALEELENIVKKMENDKLSLNDMMKYFEKGKKLSDYCGKKLSEYEKKIEILVDKNAEKNENAWKEFKS